MTNRMSVYLFVIIAAALMWDGMSNDWNATFFLARKLSGLIEWMAFWR